MKVPAEPPELVLLELIGGDFPPTLPPVNVDPDEVGGVLTNSLHHLTSGLALKRVDGVAKNFKKPLLVSGEFGI